jgi:hypothetical protein
MNAGSLEAKVVHVQCINGKRKYISSTDVVFFSPYMYKCFFSRALTAHFVFHQNLPRHFSNRVARQSYGFHKVVFSVPAVGSSLREYKKSVVDDGKAEDRKVAHAFVLYRDDDRAGPKLLGCVSLVSLLEDGGICPRFENPTAVQSVIILYAAQHIRHLAWQVRVKRAKLREALARKNKTVLA